MRHWVEIDKIGVEMKAPTYVGSDFLYTLNKYQEPFLLKHCCLYDTVYPLVFNKPNERIIKSFPMEEQPAGFTIKQYRNADRYNVVSIFFQITEVDYIIFTLTQSGLFKTDYLKGRERLITEVYLSNFNNYNVDVRHIAHSFNNLDTYFKKLTQSNNFFDFIYNHLKLH